MSGSLVLLFYIVISQHKSTTNPLVVQRGLSAKHSNADRGIVMRSKDNPSVTIATLGRAATSLCWGET